MIKPGRPHGAVSKTAKLSREAIARFVDSNIPKFEHWLSQVADGIPQYDNKGIVKDADGVILWLVKPDPLAAIKVVADICEYHLPKLSRSEATVTVENPNLKTLTIDELLQLKQELESETPQWLK